MQPSLSKFIKITPCSRATKLVNFQIISTLSNESWNKILPSLSQTFTTHHPNVLTPILSLSEGRAGIAWVPSNKMLSPPDIKCLSLSSRCFLLTSTLILSFLTLSLRLQLITELSFTGTYGSQHVYELQGVPFKMHPKCNHLLRYKMKQV
jgi:hypothetical protein